MLKFLSSKVFYKSTSDNIVYDKDSGKEFLQKDRWLSYNCLSKIKYLVYLDSKDVNSITQILKWFEYEFFSRQDTAVAFKRYKKKCCILEDKLKSNNITFYSISKFSSVTINNVSAVFYPFNTNTNPILIKKRNCKHIFIGHGESDKRASINPMLRMYDHIFVSGDETINRLKDNRIVNQLDIDEHRCIKVGLPYLGENSHFISSAECKEIKFTNSKTVLYAPTWEGVEPSQQYSSLEGYKGKELINTLLNQGDTVYFKPHPSTGQKQKEYLNYLQTIFDLFSNHPKFNMVLDVNTSLWATLKIGKQKKSKIISTLDYSKFDLAFCDISSMISICLVHSIPTVALAKSRLMNNSLSDYCSSHPLLNHCYDVIVDLEGLQGWSDRQWTAEQHRQWFAKYRINIKQMVSLESDECSTMTNQEYFNWLMSKIL